MWMQVKEAVEKADRSLNPDDPQEIIPLKKGFQTHFAPQIHFITQ
jgi:hypothetical protein